MTLNRMGRIALLSLIVLLSACSQQGNIPNTGASQSPTALPLEQTPAVGVATAVPLATEAQGVTIEPLAPTPATGTNALCTTPATLTPAQTEGPYFKAGSPEASKIGEGLPGTRLILTGYVLDENCNPIPGALLDFWQADAQGNYDNSGYILRGHQFADVDGRYRLDTVVPGLYPGRTEHIHVKVQAPNGPVLTTQLYFPNVSQNNSDNIYNKALLVTVQSATADEVQATFDFVIPAK